MVECTVLGLFGVAIGEVVAARVAISLAGLQNVPNSNEHGVLDSDDSFDGSSTPSQATILSRIVRVLGP